MCHSSHIHVYKSFNKDLLLGITRFSLEAVKYYSSFTIVGFNCIKLVPFQFDNSQ